jgi:hypothetical protein
VEHGPAALIRRSIDVRKRLEMTDRAVLRLQRELEVHGLRLPAAGGRPRRGSGDLAGRR